MEIVAKMQETVVVCITETKLKDEVPNETIDCQGMKLCRLDRTNAAGGGIAVFINNKIPFKVHKDLRWLTIVSGDFFNA